MGGTHHVEAAVAVLEGSQISTIARELLTFWPFTHQALDDDLRGAGFTPVSNTFTPDADRHLVTAIRGAATTSIDRPHNNAAPPAGRATRPLRPQRT